MPLLPVFERLARYHDFVLKIVGAGRTFHARGVRLVQKPYDLRSDVAEFQDMDIGMYPLVDEPWSLGKAGLKAVQYMAVGIPVVASSVGSLTEIVRDGECGFFARTDDEWADRLAQLLMDEPLRRRMGEQGRKLVEERYCVQVQAQVLAEIFDRVSRPGGEQ
jgi:glycosyltransferase involved in cell wall biosynthesis